MTRNRLMTKSKVELISVLLSDIKIFEAYFELHPEVCTHEPNCKSPRIKHDIVIHVHESTFFIILSISRNNLILIVDLKASFFDTYYEL